MAKFEITAQVKMAVEAPDATAAEKAAFATLSQAKLAPSRRRRKGAEPAAAPVTAEPIGVTVSSCMTTADVTETT